ncbi:enoyl-CoA hydratase/isomerase family protein [Sphingomonas radiodurans]|uniref:enoyl-CoA hydratase/isomerase family protein n=1 Tax=Sphingomonas radiodurans TaxID=2890321 RepID=UPI001E60D516|nr:enoyl-CoA hydratase-related protein [Sphingomonas radiodurans]WBH18001.1 enoyl-CoA hydratase-related protein [Sphingomonas radiodurans]
MTLRLDRRGAVAHLLIDRAAKRNAFTQAMWEALPTLIDEAMADPAVRVLVVRAAEPGAFSAGADIAEFGAGARDPHWRAANQAAIAHAQRTLARAPKPVIAFIEGDCVGGGCGIAIACDLRVARAPARFGITPAKLGLVYSLHDTKLLVDLVGPSQAKRILFTGALLDTDEALRIGLIDLVADDPQELAETIAANSAHSIGHSKAIVRRILDGQADDDAETSALFAEAFSLPDFAEGVEAFLARRPPDFRRGGGA